MPHAIDWQRKRAVRARVDQTLGAIIAHNNESARRNGQSPAFELRPDTPWARSLRSAWPAIRAEWDELMRKRYVFPKIEALLTESQGNEGDWHAGILVVRPAQSPFRSVPVDPLASLMPATTALLLSHQQIRSAMLSIMHPQMLLPTHQGPNAGVLRYHLGIDCPPGATLTTVRADGSERVTQYEDREDLLFDDTLDHRASHEGSRPRVTLFCEVNRPMRGFAHARNQAAQALFSLDARYRTIPERAAHQAAILNDAGRERQTAAPEFG